MQERAQIIDDIAGSIRARKPDGPVRHLLRVAPGGEGRAFVQGLAAALKSEERRVIELELPAYDIDASEHVLGQLCDAVGPAALPESTWNAGISIRERVASIVGKIAQEGQDAPLLALYIPLSWFCLPQDPRRALPDNPRSVLSALLEQSLDTVVASAEAPSWLQQQARVVAKSLPMPEAAEGYLFEERRWHALGGRSLLSQAERLEGIIGSGASWRSPLVLRLGVACLALRQPEPELQQVFKKPDPYDDLVGLLRSALREQSDWRLALRRLLLPRFPVPRALFEELASEMNDEQRALAGCLSHEEGGALKADEALREIVGVVNRPEPEANRRLMEHYLASDGAPTPREAAAKGSLRALLEADHHRAHAGARAPGELRPLSRLIQYERAWSLSVEFKEYKAAAAEYRSILKESPEDAYSHHYLAWNLDKAGEEGQTAREEYRRAIGIEPSNPWYHSRFITFLRGNGFRRDAHLAWDRAVAEVLPGEWATRVKLPRHLHYWVARSAVDVGDLALARKVLGTLTAQDFKSNRKLVALREELEQYEEIERLGEPVYPSSVLMAERWQKPLLLPSPIRVEDRRHGKKSSPRETPLVDWYPGRVASIEDGKVTLVLAEPKRRELFTVEVDEQALVGMANGDPPRLGRFLEHGGYEGQVARVRYHPPPRARSPQERARLEEDLRYLRDERPSEEA